MGELQKHKNAKQEHQSTGEHENNVVRELRNTEREGNIAEREGPQECAPISGSYQKNICLKGTKGRSPPLL